MKYEVEEFYYLTDPSTCVRRTTIATFSDRNEAEKCRDILENNKPSNKHSFVVIGHEEITAEVVAKTYLMKYKIDV